MIIKEMILLGCEKYPMRYNEGKAGIDLIKTQVRSTTANDICNNSQRLVSVLMTNNKLDHNHNVKETEGYYI